MLVHSSLRNIGVHMVKVDHKFDEAKIEEELICLNDDSFYVHRQKPIGSNKLRQGSKQYHTGGWLKIEMPLQKWRDLRFDYIMEMAEWFKSEILRVQLLKLKAGHKINPHVGNIEEQEKARFIIPLVTNPKVSYHVEDKTYYPKRGEIWYINQTRVHWVENNSDQDRIVAAIDVVPNVHVMSLIF